MKIVVIIPSYKERENLEILVEELEKQFKKIKKHQMWILNIDANSGDGTAEFIKRKAKEYGNIEFYLEKKKEGLGAAYIKGMKYAMEKMKANAVIEFDADLQHDPKDMPKLVEKFDQGYDYVIGSRFVKGGSIPEEWAFYRKFLSRYGGLFTRIVLFFPNINKVRDVSTGLKLTKVKGVLDKVDFSKISRGFYYKTQMLYQIVNMGAKTVEVPIHFRLRAKGETKMPLSNIIGTFWNVILLRFQDPKTIQFLKFAVVGFIGFIVNTIGLEIFVRLGLRPSISGMLGAEMAIVSNFTLNNIWTFAEKKIVSWTKIPIKFIQFNITSLGALFIQGATIELGTFIFGGLMNNIFSGAMMPYWGRGGYRFFYVMGVGFGLIWNFFAYTTFIWKTRKSKLFGRLQEKLS